MKHIVFCADGTWNGQNVDDDNDGIPDSTNVLKLFHLLEGDTMLESRRLKDENEKVLGDLQTPALVAKYLHGVGDSSNPIKKIVGGAFGTGMVSRIVRGYTFISRHYSEGDRIWIVGFSRGAYTARALAGMISSVGLIPPQALSGLPPDKAKEKAYSIGLSAWLQYREKAKAKQPNTTLKQKLADLISSFMQDGRPQALPPNMVGADIFAVAVWDTVGALGIPNFSANNQDADAFRFADNALSGKVKHGLHAVSHDERRTTFIPTLWLDDPARIQQVLFAGAHADVGGGYPERESGLSNIALKWMVDELAKLGLPFKPFKPEWVLDPQQKMHEPWNEPLFRAAPNAARSWQGYTLTKHPTLSARLATQKSRQPTS